MGQCRMHPAEEQYFSASSCYGLRLLHNWLRLYNTFITQWKGYIWSQFSINRPSLCKIQRFDRHSIIKHELDVCAIIYYGIDRHSTTDWSEYSRHFSCSPKNQLKSSYDHHFHSHAILVIISDSEFQSTVNFVGLPSDTPWDAQSIWQSSLINVYFITRLFEA